jgi:HNH endonuclease.
MPSASSGGRRWLVCSLRSLRLRPPQSPAHPHQRLGKVPGAHPRQGPLRVLRGEAVAWQTEHQRALGVDHIVPRNQGGPDDLGNLQALWFRCNAGKRHPARGRLCVLSAGGQRPGAGGKRAEVQSLTTNAFRLNSMRTWLSNRWISSGRARSSNAARSGLPMLPVATIRSLAGVPRNR